MRLAARNTHEESLQDSGSNALQLNPEPDDPEPFAAVGPNSGRSSRWAVILAGGDGTRLLSLTRTLTGDDTPKQFCALTAGETLLEQTRRRVARIVPAEQQLLLLTRTHERFYADQLRGVSSSNLLVQPWNHGTAPAIVYGLTRLRDMRQDPIVGFFPSDHHFACDQAFAAAVNRAFTCVECSGDHVLLLGIAPDAPEEAYGWIEPGVRLHSGVESPLFKVRRFWEKPSRDTARSLFGSGCLWNSFVMIGRVSAFLNMVRRSLPDLLASFENLQSAIQDGREDSALTDLFSRIPSSNFSHDVLSVRPADLAVLPVQGLGWTDLGEPERVRSALRQQA